VKVAAVRQERKQGSLWETSAVARGGERLEAEGTSMPFSKKVEFIYECRVMVDLQPRGEERKATHEVPPSQKEGKP